MSPAKNSSEPEKDFVSQLAHTFEWLITAFVLAFVFRAFVMEAFRIPTGSMADTLMGNHYRIRCSQCGYEYEYGFTPQRYGLPRNAVPEGAVKKPVSRCPSCGHYQAGGSLPVSKGDRILVLKFIYQFFEPKRWDVVVFKNPRDPALNYIKRLIGKPGETVEIIDGDIYIDGEIARKPAKVQQKLWQAVYDDDYTPTRPSDGVFNGHRWRRPFNFGSSDWQPVSGRPNRFRLETEMSNQFSSLKYESDVGNSFRVAYAYNDIDMYEYQPFCSDLMINYYFELVSRKARIGAAIEKYGTTYLGWFDSVSNEIVVAKKEEGEGVVKLKSKQVPTLPRRPVRFEFADVDHLLLLRVGDEKLKYDLGKEPDTLDNSSRQRSPEVSIIGQGNLVVSHTGIYKDIYYTSQNFYGNGEKGFATEGNPLTLDQGQYFVLGDNSPSSEDGRWWDEKGIGNNGKRYRAGIVPQEYLVGKALFVYWPSGFKPFKGFKLHIIPNVGKMRFIYGGSADSL